MDEEAFKALLERHARELEELKNRLDATRETRAEKAAKAEREKPTPLTFHPPGMTPAKPSDEFLVYKHRHSLAINDERQIAALRQKQAAEQERERPGPTEGFNKKTTRPDPSHSDDPLAAHMKRLEERNREIQRERELQKAHDHAQGPTRSFNELGGREGPTGPFNELGGRGRDR